MSARRASVHVSVVYSLSHPCRYGDIAQSCVYLVLRVSLVCLVSIRFYSKAPKHIRATSDQYGVFSMRPTTWALVFDLVVALLCLHRSRMIRNTMYFRFCDHARFAICFCLGKTWQYRWLGAEWSCRLRPTRTRAIWPSGMDSSAENSPLWSPCTFSWLPGRVWRMQNFLCLLINQINYIHLLSVEVVHGLQ